MSNEINQTDMSVCDADRYIELLASVSDKTNLVVSSEDVYNQFGVLLVKSGTPLNDLVIEKMLGHRLNKPVDDIFQVQRRMGVADLVSRFNDLTGSEPDLAAVAQHFRSEDRLRHLCHRAELSPILMQRLTVLEQSLPRVFQRALFAAWLASLMAQEQDRDAVEVELALVAGLCHDFGLMHIPQDLVDKKRDIQPEEWREIQRHVVHGALLAEHIGPDPERLAGIVLQHHERCDGAGYPTGKIGSALDPLSQLIALSDMIHALRFQRLLLNSETTLLDTMAFLRVNTRTFGHDNYQAIAKIFSSAEQDADDKQDQDDLPSVDELLEINACIGAIMTRLMSARELLEAAAPSRLTESLLSLTQQVQWVSLSSGIGNEVIEYLLRDREQDGGHLQELRDTVITAQEMIWLIRRVDRQLQELGSDPGADFANTALPTLTNEIRGQLDKAWGILNDARASCPVP